MRVGVAATPDVAIPTLDWLLHSEHEIALIITQPDRPAGRGLESRQSVVADWGHDHNIAVFKAESAEDLQGKIEDLDLVLTIGYGVLLPEIILSLPKSGFLNLHFSLLPSYRGAAPVQRALQNGEIATGVCVFQLEKGMDTGPIFAQEKIDIDPSWRSAELLRHLASIAPRVVERAFEMIAAGEAPTDQMGPATLAPKITKAEAKINFHLDSITILNWIRAFTYEPGAWTTWKSQPFKICSSIQSEPFEGTPGEIRVIGRSVFVATSSGAIEVLRVIPAGKREMDGIEWARGARLTGGEIFG